jgi:hypothetical protein
VSLLHHFNTVLLHNGILFMRMIEIRQFLESMFLLRNGVRYC